MIALYHSFVTEVAQGDPSTALAALRLIEHVRRRTRALPLVHETLSTFETGRGPLVQWANQVLGDEQRRPLVELLLHSLSGPFVGGGRFVGPVEPSVDTLSAWLQDLVRALLGDESSPGTLVGMVSPAPNGGANAEHFAAGSRGASNWLDMLAFDHELTSISVGRNALEVLLAAEQEMGGQLVVLPTAKRSAADWTLECTATELHRALLGLEEYVTAAREGLPRERCAERYHERTTIPMSQESAATWRMPTRRRQRQFVAGPHGQQYFDMHTKPGNLTRVHIWVPPVDPAQPISLIYVGYCGKHLD